MGMIVNFYGSSLEDRSTILLGQLTSILISKMGYLILLLKTSDEIEFEGEHLAFFPEKKLKGRKNAWSHQRLRRKNREVEKRLHGDHLSILPLLNQITYPNK